MTQGQPQQLPPRPQPLGLLQGAGQFWHDTSKLLSEIDSEGIRIQKKLGWVSPEKAKQEIAKNKEDIKKTELTKKEDAQKYQIVNRIKKAPDIVKNIKKDREKDLKDIYGEIDNDLSLTPEQKTQYKNAFKAKLQETNQNLASYSSQKIDELAGQVPKGSVNAFDISRAKTEAELNTTDGYFNKRKLENEIKRENVKQGLEVLGSTVGSIKKDLIGGANFLFQTAGNMSEYTPAYVNPYGANMQMYDKLKNVSPQATTQARKQIQKEANEGFDKLNKKIDDTANKIGTQILGKTEGLSLKDAGATGTGITGQNITKALLPTAIEYGALSGTALGKLGGEIGGKLLSKALPKGIVKEAGKFIGTEMGETAIASPLISAGTTGGQVMEGQIRPEDMGSQYVKNVLTDLATDAAPAGAMFGAGKLLNKGLKQLGKVELPKLPEFPAKKAQAQVETPELAQAIEDLMVPPEIKKNTYLKAVEDNKALNQEIKIAQLEGNYQRVGELKQAKQANQETLKNLEFELGVPKEQRIPVEKVEKPTKAIEKPQEISLKMTQEELNQLDKLKAKEPIPAEPIQSPQIPQKQAIPQELPTKKLEPIVTKEALQTGESLPLQKVEQFQEPALPPTKPLETPQVKQDIPIENIPQKPQRIIRSKEEIQKEKLLKGDQKELKQSYEDGLIGETEISQSPVRDGLEELGFNIKTNKKGEAFTADLVPPINPGKIPPPNSIQGLPDTVKKKIAKAELEDAYTRAEKLGENDEEFFNKALERYEKKQDLPETPASPIKLEEGQKIAKESEKLQIKAPKNVKEKLYEVGRKVFGLEKNKAAAHAIVSDAILKEIAKRSNKTAKEIFDSIEYKKGNIEELRGKEGVKFQGDAINNRFNGSKKLSKFAKNYKSFEGLDSNIPRFDSLADLAKEVRAVNYNNFDRLGGEELVTVYRGVSSDVNKIEKGDWVTLSKERASTYSKNVRELKVKKSDIVDPKIEKDEYIYAPKNIEKTKFQLKAEWDKAQSSDVKFQSQKGAMLEKEGKTVIYALTDPNVSTPLHELAHVYEKVLNKQETNIIEKWSGAKRGTTEYSEKFARGFEKYLSEGKAPTKELTKVFEKFKTWLTDIYKGITGSEIDLKLNDEMRRVYDQMLGKQPEIETTLKPSEIKTKERGLSKRIKEQELFDEGVQEKYREKPLEYEVKTQEYIKKVANEKVKDYESALKSKIELEKKLKAGEDFTAEDEGIMIKAIDEIRKSGNDELAFEMIDDLAEKLTTAGQLVAHSKLISKMTPEDIIMKARKELNKATNPALKELEVEAKSKTESLIEDSKRVIRKNGKSLIEQLDDFCGF